MSLVTLQRLGPMSSLFFASSFNTMSMLAFLSVTVSPNLNSLGSVTALPLVRAGYNIVQVSILFVSICTIYMCISLIISITIRPQHLRAHDITTFFSGIIKNNKTIIQFTSLSLLAWSILHFIDIDASKIWINNAYLALLNPDVAGIDTLPGRLFNTAQRYIGMLSLVFFYITLKSKNYTISFIFGLVVVYIMTLSLARASRYVPVFFALILIMDYLYIKKINTTKLVLIVAVVFSYFLVILMRREDTQGLSSIGPAILNFDPASTIEMLQGILVNAFQGTLIVDLSISTPASHLENYKVLSFSPLPGFIDGFPYVRSASEIRITPFNPMNSYGEAYHFGFSYLILWIFITSLTFAIVDAALRKSKTPLSLAALIISFLLVLVLSQYQIRTSIKFASLVIAMSLPSLIFSYIKLRSK